MSKLLIYDSARALHAAFLNGHHTAREIAACFLERIQKRDHALGAFLTVDEEQVLLQADAVDRKREAGEPVGALGGVPVAVKDNICTRNLKTTCASRILQRFVPAYDAHVVEQIRSADGIILGKTNLDEFAMGSSTEYSSFGPCRNPFDLKRVPGGSSGGSAASVAARLAPLALGTDTGGSVRQPAAFCGIPGLKPTYGRVSRFGVAAFASSLDQVGPMASNLDDLKMLYEVIAGRDRRDSTSRDVALARPMDPGSLRVGVLSLEGTGVQVEKPSMQAVEEVVALLETDGRSVERVEAPLWEHALSIYAVLSAAEASSNLARYDGLRYSSPPGEREGLKEHLLATREEGFGDEVARRILLGTFVLSHGYKERYYQRALDARRLLQEEFDRLFSHVDVLLTPTSPVAPFLLKERLDNPWEMLSGDYFTVPPSLAGLPALSIPVGLDSAGLPRAVQMVAPHWREEDLFALGRTLEEAVGTRPEPDFEREDRP